MRMRLFTQGLPVLFWQALSSGVAGSAPVSVA